MRRRTVESVAYISLLAGALPGCASGAVTGRVTGECQTARDAKISAQF